MSGAEAARGAGEDGRGPVPVWEGMQEPEPARRPRPAARPPDRDRRKDPVGPERPLPDRSFQVDGVEWLARRAGSGLTGTGAVGAAPVQAIHFLRAAHPDRPVREALLPRGRLAHLYEAELRAVWEQAVEIEWPEDRAPGEGT